jgi:hypothetical protein
MCSNHTGSGSFVCLSCKFQRPHLQDRWPLYHPRPSAMKILQRRHLLQGRQLGWPRVLQLCPYYVRYRFNGSYANLLIATTTGTPNLIAFWICFAILTHPSSTNLTFSVRYTSGIGKPGVTCKLGCCSLLQLYLWSTTMHLQSLDSGNQYHTIRHQGARATLDVESFLHPTIGTKATFRNHVSSMFFARFTRFGACKFQCNLVCNGGRVSVSYICKRTCMDKDGSSLSISNTLSRLTSRVCMRFGLQLGPLSMEVLDSVLHKNR